MAVIDPKYSIGIPEMDAQHARWIHLIEDFRTSSEGRLLEQTGLTAAQHALEELLNYTRNHFASEECFLVLHKYPELEAHKRQHQELEAEVVKLLEEIRLHRTNTTPLKLNLFVTIWLMEHIMQDDDKYARYIRAKT